MTEAYPLQWPAHKSRARFREKSRFKVSFAKARDELIKELKMLGAKYIVLSTNIPLKNDGMPYANFRTPDDAGVAAYFSYKEKSMCFACDRWEKIEDNIQAIRHTIAALRGIARWGTGDMLQAAFEGFQALPPPGAKPKREWWTVLQVDRSASLALIEMNFRHLAKDYHPDIEGGDHDRMAELNAAMSAARKEKTS